MPQDCFFPCTCTSCNPRTGPASSRSCPFCRTCGLSALPIPRQTIFTKWTGREQDRDLDHRLLHITTIVLHAELNVAGNTAMLPYHRGTHRLAHDQRSAFSFSVQEGVHFRQEGSLHGPGNARSPRIMTWRSAPMPKLACINLNATHRVHKSVKWCACR